MGKPRGRNGRKHMSQSGGRERVSNERERMSQCFRSLHLTPTAFPRLNIVPPPSRMAELYAGNIRLAVAEIALTASCLPAAVPILNWHDLSLSCQYLALTLFPALPFSCSLGKRVGRPLLTASSVIPVMPVCMLMLPNPGSRNEWPLHCDGGIHHVRPVKFGAEIGVVIICMIAPHIPRKNKKPAK